MNVTFTPNIAPALANLATPARPTSPLEQLEQNYLKLASQMMGAPGTMGYQPGRTRAQQFAELLYSYLTTLESQGALELGLPEELALSTPLVCLKDQTQLYFSILARLIYDQDTSLLTTAEAVRVFHQSQVAVALFEEVPITAEPERESMEAQSSKVMIWPIYTRQAFAEEAGSLHLKTPSAALLVPSFLLGFLRSTINAALTGIGVDSGLDQSSFDLAHDKRTDSLVMIYSCQKGSGIASVHLDPESGGIESVVKLPRRAYSTES